MPWLTILVALPLLGAGGAGVFKGKTRQLIGIVTASITLILAIFLVIFRADLDEDYHWISQIGSHYALKLDGLSSLLVLVAVVLVVAVILVRWRSAGSLSNFVPLALALEGVALLTFIANDVFLFFLAFEATLVPIYFMIGLGGDPKRTKAALKFVIYQLAGGLVFLGGLIYLIIQAAEQPQPSLLFDDLSALALPIGAQQALCLVFFLPFAVKAPLVPVHSWLPDVIERGRTSASMLLVGLLDGLGIYGMVRFCFGLTPQAITWAAGGFAIVGLVSIIYGALAAISSTNLMRIVAFASISHTGMMILGIFALTTASLTGALTYLAAHGLSGAALVLTAGRVLRRRSGELARGSFGGLANSMPVLAGFFLIAGLATLALPGTFNFAAELPLLLGTWSRYPVLAALALIGVLAAGVYILWAYQRIFNGPAVDRDGNPVTDVDALKASGRKDLPMTARWAIGSILALLLVFGLVPGLTQQMVSDNVTTIMTQVQISDPEAGG